MLDLERRNCSNVFASSDMLTELFGQVSVESRVAAPINIVDLSKSRVQRMSFKKRELIRILKRNVEKA